MSSKRAVWRNRLAAWRASGQSVAAFCRSRGWSRAQFVYWQRVFGAAAASREDALSLVPVVVNAQATPPPGAGFDTIEVVLPNGICVRMPSGQGMAQTVVLVRGLLAC